jgi:hypothetical protein
VSEADPLEVAAWRMAAGSLPSEELPQVATEALVRGRDSPALRVLAGQSTDDVRDSADLFRVALDELGIDLPDPDSAHWRLARRAASDIVAGRISPGSGATELRRAYGKVRDNGDLRIFVGLTSMLDDHPDNAGHIEADIVMAAQELLARPFPRRWIKLMAARERSPITQTVGPDSIEVDPRTLHLSDSLHADVARWNAYFAAAMAGWPASGGFNSEHDAETFAAAGRQLVSRLQDELGANYRVEYMPEPIRPPRVKLRDRGSD